MTKTVLAFALAGVVGAPAPARTAENAPDSGATVSTTLAVPDGTVLYVRYGEPGGVRVRSRWASGNAADSTWWETSDPTALGRATSDPAALPSAATEAVTADLASMIRVLLREELDRHLAQNARASVPAGAGLRDSGAGPGLTPIEPLAARSRRSPGTVEILSGTPGTIVADVGPAAVADSTSPLGLAGTPDDTPDSSSLQAALGFAGSAADPPLPSSSTTTPLPVPTPAVVRERILDDGLFRTNLVLFETSSDRLLEHSQEVLKVVGDVLRDFPEASVLIEGHADRRGTEEFNLALSQRRAETVRTFLLDCCQLDPARLEARGFGESVPLAPGDSPTALALNRRVEFRILNPEALRR